MNKTKETLDLVNTIVAYVKESKLEASDIIFACEIVETSVLKGFIEELK